MQDERKPEINCVSSPFKQIVAAWLNWDGFFFLYFIRRRASMSFSSVA